MHGMGIKLSRYIKVSTDDWMVHFYKFIGRSWIPGIIHPLNFQNSVILIFFS